LGRSSSFRQPFFYFLWQALVQEEQPQADEDDQHEQEPEVAHVRGNMPQVVAEESENREDSQHRQGA
jgi:hypothetical protein